MMQLARSRAVGKKVAGQYYACACRFSSTQSSATRQPSEDYETVEQMLRPPPPGNSPLWAHHKKNFRTSRYPTYDFDFNFKNNNAEVAGDKVPERFENQWRYRLTIMRGNAESRADTGKKLIASAHDLIKKGTPPDVKWLDKAMYETGTAEQVEELYKLAEELRVVDSKLTSTYIYNLARRAGFEKAIEKYESVKQEGKADNDIHASGVAAYAKAMQGEKALAIYEKLQKELGPKVPSRVHSSMMTYYFDFGEMRKGFELYNNIDKNGGIIDTRILTSLIRGHRLAGNLKAAQATFDSIAKRELQTDINAHCELIMAYAKPGNNVGEMMAKLQQMKNVGYRPPHTLYNYVIRCMLEKEEFNNALMALDMQFKEKSYPLDKHLIIRTARHFAKLERGERIKEKTEYAIWIGRKAGLYTDDLFFMTTPHFDLMDEYYFRHHPEYDFPNELRKPYQFKEFDEYPVFHEDKFNNPFQRKVHARLAAQAVPQESRPWNAELPSFSEDYNIITMKPPTFENWAQEKNAEQLLAEYDAKSDAVWAEMVGRFEAIVEEGRSERRQIAILEERVARRRREVEAYRQMKEEREKKAKEVEGKEKEGEKVEGKEAETKEGEVAKEAKATEGHEKKEVSEEKKEASEEKKEVSEEKKEATEEKKEVTEEKKEATGEKKEEKSKEPTETIAATEQELAAAREKEAKEREEKEKAEEQQDKENAEAIVRESPQLQAMKDAQETARTDRKNRLDQLFEIVKQFKKYDDVLPAQERMDPALRAELVQQKRIAHTKASLTGYRRLPAYIMPQQFDTRRLRVLAAACDDALAFLRAETDMRKPVDTEIRIAHVENYKKQTLELLAKKYEVAHPLDLKPIPNLQKYRDLEKLETLDLEKEKVQTSVEAKDDPYKELTLEARLYSGVITVEDLETMVDVNDGDKDEPEALALKLRDSDSEEIEEDQFEEPKKPGLFSDVSKLLGK